MLTGIVIPDRKVKTIMESEPEITGLAKCRFIVSYICSNFEP